MLIWLLAVASILVAVIVTRVGATDIQHRLVVAGACFSIACNLAFARFEPWPEIGIIAFFLALSVVMLASRMIELNAWRRAQGTTLILHRPRAGHWKIAAGGPILLNNHHAAVATQRFAYDLIRTDASSLGTPIFAPINGIVEVTRDTMPDNGKSSLGILQKKTPESYGNFVAIRSEGATVVVCHLREGSVCVEPGQELNSEMQIGECGNSGNSTQPHIHIHAQNLPVDRGGDGIPIGFASENGAFVPVPGDCLP